MRLAEGLCFVLSGMPTHRSDSFGLSRDMLYEEIATKELCSDDEVDIL